MTVQWEDKREYPNYSETNRVDGIMMVRRLKQAGLVARLVYGQHGYTVQAHKKSRRGRR